MAPTYLILLAVASVLISTAADVTKPINIAWCQSGGVDARLLRSMMSVYATADTTTRPRLRFYVLHEDDTLMDKVASFASSFKLNITSIKPDIKFPVQPRVWGYRGPDARLNKLTSAGNYWRFYLPELLKTEEKVLYLDTDTLITSDIAAVYDRVLRQDQLMASGAQNPRYCWASKIINVNDARIKDLNMPPKAPCLSSAVMFMNIQKWMRLNVSERAWHYVKLNAESKLYALGSLPPLMLALQDDWERLGEDAFGDMKGKACCFNMPRNGSCILHPVKHVIAFPTWYPRLEYESPACYATKLAAGSNNIQVSKVSTRSSGVKWRFIFSSFGSGTPQLGSDRIPLLLAEALEQQLNQNVTVYRWCPREYNAEFLITKQCACIEAARAANPTMVIGVAKPVNPDKMSKCLHLADFVIADNRHQVNLFTNAGVAAVWLKLIERFPAFSHTPRQGFTALEPAVVCYHGNANHYLSLLHDHLQILKPDSFGVPFRLYAIVPPEEMRRLNNASSGLTVQYELSPFNPHTYADKLKKCDVGLVPQFRAGAPEVACVHNDCQDIDISVRYKLTANAGRAYVFNQLGVPVVADSVSEVAEIVGDNQLGMLLDSRDHELWVSSIKLMLKDDCIRSFYAQRARKFSEANLTPQIEAAKLLSFAEKIKNKL